MNKSVSVKLLSSALLVSLVATGCESLPNSDSRTTGSTTAVVTDDSVDDTAAINADTSNGRV